MELYSEKAQPVFKMKKTIVFIILGIFLVGASGAVAFGIDKDFKDKVKKIDSDKLCEKLKKSDGTYKNKYCKKNKEKLNVEDSLISITQNKDGVIKVTGVGGK
jgi:hypothetical protein